MTKRWMGLVLGGAAAAVAIGAGAVAVNAASPATGRTVLSEDDVARQLAAQPAGTASQTAGVTADGATKVVTTAGGTVVIGCQGADQAVLVRWTPKTGNRSDRVNAGPAAQASIKFEGAGTEVTVVATCANGVPDGVATTDDNHGGAGTPTGAPQPTPSDDHGGNRGGGGNGGGGTDDPTGHH